MIPKVLHYCFGLTPDFGDKPWSLVHYACVKSAVERIRPQETYFYCEYEPSGPWWDLTRKMITLRRIEAPREIFGKPLLHPAHRADVVRLEKLLSAGGIYLDADVFVHKGFDCLLQYKTVLGEQQADGVTGLCNAIILAEPQAPFLQRWLSTYVSFRSRGRDAHWDEHSVQMPYQLSRINSDEITILPPSAFFLPTFTPSDLAMIFESNTPLDNPNSYATHLWESLVWHRHLEDLTPGRVRSIDTNFHTWIRPFIRDLPDNYGAPGFSYRLRRNIRRFVGRVRSKLRTMRSKIGRNESFS
jgi:Glycosyltransferase sugar-binding region containing DXD motif